MLEKFFPLRVGRLFSTKLDGRESIRERLEVGARELDVSTCWQKFANKYILIQKKKKKKPGTEGPTV